MQEQKAIIKNAVIELAKSGIQSRPELTAANRKIAKEFGIKMLTSAELIKMYKQLVKEKSVERNLGFERLLRKRAVRTLSGIAPVAVLTKPYPCPGKCAYCPTEKYVPQSYLSNEPAVMRAIRCGYDPYVQVQDRLRALVANGHEPTKIELIVIGGTWSYLPKKYQYWYITNCFKAANDFTASAVALSPTADLMKKGAKAEGDGVRLERIDSAQANIGRSVPIKKSEANPERLLI